MVDTRRFLRTPDAEPTDAQQQAYEHIVTQNVQRLRNATREVVGQTLNELERNPSTERRVGRRLVARIKSEIERRLEE